MSNENKSIIKAINMFGSVPEQWELLEEIERLNNTIKQQDTRNSRQRIANRKLLERNQDLVIENLKLNNITNELERYIVYQLQILNNPEDYYAGTYVRDILYRLKELKGSDKK